MAVLTILCSNAFHTRASNHTSVGTNPTTAVEACEILAVNYLTSPSFSAHCLSLRCIYVCASFHSVSLLCPSLNFSSLRRPPRRLFLCFPREQKGLPAFLQTVHGDGQRGLRLKSEPDTGLGNRDHHSLPRARCAKRGPRDATRDASGQWGVGLVEVNASLLNIVVF